MQTQRITYLEGFRDALDVITTYLRRLGTEESVSVNDLIEALNRALAHVEEEIRSYKRELSLIQSLLEELEKHVDER